MYDSLDNTKSETLKHYFQWMYVVETEPVKITVVKNLLCFKMK